MRARESSQSACSSSGCSGNGSPISCLVAEEGLRSCVLTADKKLLCMFGGSHSWRLGQTSVKDSAHLVAHAQMKGVHYDGSSICNE